MISIPETKPVRANHSPDVGACGATKTTDNILTKVRTDTALTGLLCWYGGTSYLSPREPKVKKILVR
ncbi:hypothetical protein SERLA73DRAFT_122938 [Serpula lacrymans var. lacrymans S7.3]|uniref:Uncharacterized protein n=2 Tax=Serpula lacrymans var. lacrymans TaxID=341189 RepID=F8PZ00_SERL3|nr:uncharacterized protein SERLADRAFT_449445 [Serpula lacrymans var. lacrymans S7.9]EGN99113.1 hypothetical protein SERLA73DRAFT_122938 [Serpula lacrymans var. lacrymans S7.3]EGO24682.1 hypothetical protein SERLADRAFT_449445 [Serpula lacrymans var. lacrymans S7.9]